MNRGGGRSPVTARDQAGFTLIELLAAVLLTALIMGPLAAWTISTVRQQGMMGEHLSNAVSTGRISSTFSEDVASARNVAVSGASGDCPGGPGAGGGAPGGGGGGGAGVGPNAAWFMQSRGLNDGSTLADMAGACDQLGIAVSGSGTSVDLEPLLHRTAEQGPDRPLAVTFRPVGPDLDARAETVDHVIRQCRRLAGSVPLARLTITDLDATAAAFG